ncbi:MAG TPA: 50S ribosomal protein L29 [Acidobacteriaceae bacterium]
MELDKIRNLAPQELKHEEQQASEQLFRLRFQMRLGQTEGVKKLRGLRKDVARIKTITRERELGLNAALHGQSEAAPAAKKTAAKRTKKAAAKKVVKKAVAKKKVAANKTSKKKEAR